MVSKKDSSRRFPGVPLSLLLLLVVIAPGRAEEPAPAANELPSGVTPAVSLYEPLACDGYTLIAPLISTKTFLLDMQGRVVRMWQSDKSPGESCYLLENGNILRAAKLPEEEHTFGNAPGSGGRIDEISWDGELVWSFRFVNDRQLPHHDAIKLPNGNVLILLWEKKTAEEAIQAGRDPKLVADRLVFPDSLIEVKPTGKTTGEIVWEWRVWDHLIQEFDPSKDNYGKVAEHPELIDINFCGEELDSVANAKHLASIGYLSAAAEKDPKAIMQDWTHINAVAYNAELDQIMLSPRHFSEFWIIDHSTTTAEARSHTGGKQGKGGDLLYRWGNPQAYRRGKPEDQRLFVQHSPHWIEPGLPGAGQALIFNNGTNRPGGSHSSVDEVVIPVNAKGGYSLGADGKFGPSDPIWSYSATPPKDFYALYVSGAQRMPNGNTLICGGVNGSIFEVTPEKQIVWRYTSPVIGDVDPGDRLKSLRLPPRKNPFNKSAKGEAPAFNFDELFQKRFGATTTAMGQIDTWMFRAYRYAPNYPGLKGKDLTPGLTIEKMQWREAQKSVGDDS